MVFFWQDLKCSRRSNQDARQKNNLLAMKLFDIQINYRIK